MKKIRVEGHWDQPNNILNRLLLQFKTPDIDLSNIEFVFDDSYDIGVCFNHINVKTIPEKKYFVFPHEPIWSGSHQKTLQDNATIFGFNKDYYYGKCIETPAHTFYGGRGPWVDKLTIWNYTYLNAQTFNKTKNISSCITEINTNHGLYKQRYKLLQNLLDLDFIDFYGCTNQPSDNICYSPLKIDSTASYKFTICVENDYCKNWITERFFDAILTDCVPIYFGCSNIKELYPENGYILLDEIDDYSKIKKLLKTINENAEDIYFEKINALRKIKHRYFTEHNLLKKIISL